MKREDPYVLGYKLLSLDFDSLSLFELSILEYVCTEVTGSLAEQFKKRGCDG